MGLASHRLVECARYSHIGQLKEFKLARAVLGVEQSGHPGVLTGVPHRATDPEAALEELIGYMRANKAVGPGHENRVPGRDGPILRRNRHLICSYLASRAAMLSCNKWDPILEYSKML